MTKRTCEECAYLTTKKGILCCEECFGQPIADIDDCPEGVTEEVLTEIEKHAKENKVKIVNTSEEKKERKPRVRKVDEVKVNLIQLIGEFLATQNLDFVEIAKPEREINFVLNNDEYTLTLTKHRKPKAQK